jgi:hypothetical protein
MLRVAGYAWTRTMFARMRMAVIVDFIVEMMQWGPSRSSKLLAVFIQGVPTRTRSAWDPDICNLHSVQPELRRTGALNWTERSACRSYRRYGVPTEMAETFNEKR